MNWGRLLAGAMLLVALAVPAGAAPLFPDLPENHWAMDAVRSLAAKGLVEGYPDGTFRGDRAATRYEVAMVVARLLARMEQDHATFASKADLDEVRRLAEAFREELAALGVRVTNLEEASGRLDQRVSELERIRFYGRLHTIGASNQLHGPSPNIGSNFNPGIDWSTGRLLLDGTGYTALGLLGLNVDVTDDWMAGAEFVSYISQGEVGVDQYWGVSAPWLANVWTGRNGLVPGAQPDNNQPFTRMVLDNFWMMHKPSQTRLAVGSYFTRYHANYVFNGARNPNINDPRWLPFYGANITGSLAGTDSGFKYEAFYSINPDASLYRTNSMGGTLRYEFSEDRGVIALHGVQHRNERISDGTLVGAGGPLIPLPTVSFTGPGLPPAAPGAWLGQPLGTAVPVPQFFVGPQSEFTFGLDASYLVEKDYQIRLSGEFATSSYNPDTSGMAFNTSVGGDLYRFGIGAEPIEKLFLDLEYLRVDPTYDPFIVAYPVAPGIPVFLPYGTYYSAYYQMHDYLEFPNNREGLRFRGRYAFNEDDTSVYALYSHLNQVKPTTPAQVQTVGNIEPLFSMLQAGGAEKGSVDSYGLGFSHRFDGGLKADFSYFSYDIRRGAPVVDDVRLKEDVYRLDLAYPLSEDLDVRGGWWLMDYRGHMGIQDTDFSQSIPGIGLDYRMSQDLTFSVDYRLFDFNQRAFANGDYAGSQLLLEMKLDF